MKTVLLLGGPAAGQRAEVHGVMNTWRTQGEAYRVVPMCSHGEVHWFGVQDGADPLALLIAGYGGANADLVQVMIEQAAYDDRAASDHLKATGSYSQSDEPSAVRAARLALDLMGYKP